MHRQETPVRPQILSARREASYRHKNFCVLHSLDNAVAQQPVWTAGRRCNATVVARRLSSRSQFFVTFFSSSIEHSFRAVVKESRSAEEYGYKVHAVAAQQRACQGWTGACRRLTAVERQASAAVPSIQCAPSPDPPRTGTSLCTLDMPTSHWLATFGKPACCLHLIESRQVEACARTVIEQPAAWLALAACIGAWTRPEVSGPLLLTPIAVI